MRMMQQLLRRVELALHVAQLELEPTSRLAVPEALNLRLDLRLGADLVQSHRIGVPRRVEARIKRRCYAARSRLAPVRLRFGCTAVRV